MSVAGGNAHREVVQKNTAGIIHRMLKHRAMQVVPTENGQ